MLLGSATMSRAAADKARAGRTPQGRRRVRAALALAALDLFAEQGFEATTVDQISETAGVGRRTFFRYFRSKEDVVFPDHDERLAQVVEQLESAPAEEPPLAAVCRSARTVLDGYLAEPEISLKRFRLTRQVTSLRDKEITSTDRYQRVFARFLQRRYAERGGEEPVEAGLRASVGAGAVVSAHNHVLREWLKSGCQRDAPALLDDALGRVRRSLESTWDDGSDEEVVVGVVRTRASPEAVLGQLRTALGSLAQ